MSGWFVGCLACWFAGWLVGWLVGWLLGGSAGCHPRKTQGLPRQNNRNFIQRFLQPGTYFPRLITSPLGLGGTLRLRRVGRRGGQGSKHGSETKKCSQIQGDPRFAGSFLAFSWFLEFGPMICFCWFFCFRFHLQAEPHSHTPTSMDPFSPCFSLLLVFGRENSCLPLPARHAPLRSSFEFAFVSVLFFFALSGSQPSSPLLFIWR